MTNVYTCASVYLTNQPLTAAYYLVRPPPPTMVVAWGDNSDDQCEVPFGLTNAVAIIGGADFSMALLSESSLVAWGNDDEGQTDVPTNAIHVTAIAAGWYHGIALLADGTVTAWGYNANGQTTVPTGLSNVVAIAAAQTRTLALRSNGTMVVWGSGPSGEASVPAGISNVTAIAAGGQHNLALLTNGTVTAWGLNDRGQTNVPSGLSNVVAVAAGWKHSLALKADGTVAGWGHNSYGQISIPSGLSNVVAIAADDSLPPPFSLPYSLALKSDGTVVAWGSGPVPAVPVGLDNVVSIGRAFGHALALRSGRVTPVITLSPTNQYQLAGGSVTFNSRGLGLAGVQYQWQFNGTNISVATNSTLTLTNVNAATQGSYRVIVSDGNGSITNSATFALLTPPVITGLTQPTNPIVIYPSNLNLSVTVAFQGAEFPANYQWQFDGTSLPGETRSNYIFAPNASGAYSVVITNELGSTNVTWLVQVFFPGNVWAWGDNSYGQSTALFTNATAIAAGEYHSLAVTEGGAVIAWGRNNFGQTNVPTSLSNMFAVAAGDAHNLALKTDGTIAAWGRNDFNQTNVPANATNIIAVSAGGQQSLALKKDRTIIQWGQTNALIPPGLTNITAIASGTNFHLALLSNGSVMAWGANNYGQTNVPANLSNVVVIAAGGSHALALKKDGTVSAWGLLTNVPAGLSNVMAIAAGYAHSLALKNDGTIVVWGDSSYGQFNLLSNLPTVKLIAAGGNHSLAATSSPLVQYPVDVTKDLLLIYNTNSTDSIWVKDYYLVHRPMVSGANVLAISCTNIPSIRPGDYTNDIAFPIQNWLTANPTKRPQYVILMAGIPWRVSTNPSPVGIYYLDAYDMNTGTPIALPIRESVQFQLHSWCASSWQPFVTSLNMGEFATDTNHIDYAIYTNACKGYIDKLEFIGTNYSPGKFILSASTGGYGNTNYYFDDSRAIFGGGLSDADQARSGVLNVNPMASVVYTNGSDYFTNWSLHLTNGANISGYLCWGEHSWLGGQYPISGKVKWQGNSGWWIIETIESFNGQPGAGQGDFFQWFSSNAFGGTNYSNTPIGAVTHVDEPGAPNVNIPSIYFGLWEAGKNFGICAWGSRHTPYFQAIGDPFVTK